MNVVGERDREAAEPAESPEAAWDRRLRRWRWLAAAGCVVLCGVLGARATFRARAGERGDTRFYQRGAERFWAGLPLYHFAPPGAAERPTTAYTYLPPFAAFLVWTLPIPYRVLRGLWLCATLAALAGALGVALRLARAPPSLEVGAAPAAGPDALRHPWLWAALLALLLGRFVVNDLAHGQVNAFLALLLGGGILALGRASVRAEVWGGVLIGLALVIKPTSWLLLPWLLLERRWRVLVAACLAGGAALLAAWPLYAWAGGDYLEQVGDWLRLMPEFARAESGRAYNASLASAFQRLLAGVDEPSGLRPLLGSLSPARARPWARGLACVVVALGFAWLGLRRWRGALGGGPRAAACVLALSALLSPITWKAHLVVLLPLGAYVAADLAGGRAGRGRWVGCAASVALLTLPSEGLGALAGGLEAWGGLSLGIAGLFLLGACAPPAWEARPGPGE